MNSLNKFQLDAKKEVSKDTYIAIIELLKKWSDIERDNRIAKEYQFKQLNDWIYHSDYKSKDISAYAPNRTDKDYKRLNEEVQSILKARDVLAKYSKEAADELFKKYLGYIIEDFVTSRVDEYLAQAFETVFKKIQ